MKVKTLSVLAGAAAMFATGSAQAIITLGIASYSQAESAGLFGYVDDPFLDANNLHSAVIRLQGIEPGQTIQGFIGTPQSPWDISTPSPGGFWNLAGQYGDDGFGNPTFDGATSFYAAMPATAPGAPPEFIWDSGFLGNPATFGSPAGDPGVTVGGFALSGDGSNDSNISPAAWISIQPDGFDPPQSTYNFLRVTWSAWHSLHVGLVLAGNTPPLDIPLSITMAWVPTAGTLPLLAMAGLMGRRQRRD
jgi:hypothetical protein